MKHRNRREKRSLLWTVLTFVIVAGVAVLVALALNDFQLASDSGSDGTTEESIEKDERNAILTERDMGHDMWATEDFVLFCIDEQAEEDPDSLSESVIITHIDGDAQTVRMASVSEDCLVYDADQDYGKFGYIYGSSGPEETLSVINENFDLSIAYYMILDFSDLADIIDEIGGVEMEIRDNEVSSLNWISGLFSGRIYEHGTYQLDGEQAVAYSRIRLSEEDDPRRFDRRSYILCEVLEETQSSEAVTRIALAEELLERIDSNYDEDDLLTVLYDFLTSGDTETMMFPDVFYSVGDDEDLSEVPDTLIDMNAGIHEFMYGETQYTPSEEVQSYSDAMLDMKPESDEDSLEDVE